MTYETPMIVEMSSALSTIHGQLTKPDGNIPDSPLGHTVNAYEADE